MRSVVVAKFVPWPPNSGDKRRTLGVLRALRRHGDVTLCAFTGEDEDPGPLVAEGIDVRSVPLRRRPRDVVHGLALGRSLTAARFWDRRLARVVAEATPSDTDVLVVEHVQLLPYARGLSPRLRVVDMHNIESSLARRIADSGSGVRRLVFAAEARALRALERRVTEVDVVAVVSEADRAALADVVRHPRVVVVPNAWDEPKVLPPAPGPVVSFVALLSWGPNVDAAVWFCRRVWPRVVAQFPEAHLQLVGRNPAAQVQALAGPTVEVTGTVEDLEPWYERTRVALAPLQAGGGSRLKILEALAAGRPVVATGIGAEGLEDLVGRGVVVEDDPARMAAVLVELLGDPQRCADLGRRGADAVAADHSWPAAVRPLLAELAAGPSGPSRPPRRPQVLVVENSLRENGGLRVSLEHARRFVAAGAPTTVAVIQDASDGALYAPDPSLRVDMLTPRGSRFRTAAPLALARLLVRARRADVVVAGSEVGNALLLGFLAARLVHRPFAVLVQAELDDAIDAWVPGPLRGLTRRVHARVDAAVCVAETLVPGVVANGLARERVHVAVNGIDVARVRARAGLPPSPGEDGYRHDAAAPGPVPVVMANGRLAAAKDFPLLVRAHARVLDAGVDHRLVIMGEGPERALVEATVAELAVDATVTLPGFVREPYAPIAGADLFVLSSRSEGLPLTLLEALAVGAPVISTRCGTGPDLILDGGRYGDLVPVGDLDALAAAIERHLRDPRPLRDKARHGPSRAWEFDAGHAAATVLAVLTSLTDRPGTGRGAPG